MFFSSTKKIVALFVFALLVFCLSLVQTPPTFAAESGLYRESSLGNDLAIKTQAAKEKVSSLLSMQNAQANISSVLNMLSVKIYCGITGIFANSCNLDEATPLVQDKPAADTNVHVQDGGRAFYDRTADSEVAPVTGADVRQTVIERVVEKVITPVGFAGVSADYVDARLAELAAQLRSEMTDRTVTVRASSSSSSSSLSSKQVDSIYEDMGDSIDEAIGELNDLSEEEVITLIVANSSSLPAGTPGYVLQATATSSQWVATSTLGFGGASQWDDVAGGINYAEGNVGIGTSNPLTALEITQAAPVLRLNSTNASGYLASGYIGQFEFGLYGHNNDEKIATFDTDMGEYNYGNGNLRLDGVSTISTVTVDAPGFTADDGDATGPSFAFSANTGVGLFRPALNTLGISTASTERMRIGPTGNVGIGASAPSARLHVASSTTGSANTAVFENTSTGASDQFRFQMLRGQDTGTGVTKGMSLFSYGSGTSGGAGWADYENRPLQFWTGSGVSATQKMTLTASGNLGIGTTSPTEKVGVSGNVHSSGNFYAGADSSTAPAGGGFIAASSRIEGLVGGTFQNTAAAGYEGFNFYNNSGTLVSSFAHSNGSSVFLPNSTWIGTRNTEPLYLIANSAVGVTLQNGGNVGIGTTTPAAKFHTVGASASAITSLMTLAASQTASAFVIEDSAGFDLLTHSSGSGLGSILTLSSTSTKSLKFESYAADQNYFTAAGANFRIRTSTLNAIDFFVDSSSTNKYVATFQADGGATFNPSAVANRVFTVRGNSSYIITAESYNERLGFFAGASPTTKIHAILGTGTWRTGYDASNYYNLTVGSGGAVNFDGVGTSPNFSFSDNVGIGTTTPGQALSVVGSGQFTAVGSGAYAFDLNLTSDGTLTTSASDERLKEKVKPLDSKDTLERLMRLKPSTFDWRSNGAHDIGLIAQEVEQIFPELVFTNPTDGYMGVNYSRLPALLISGIQELNGLFASFVERVEDGVAYLNEIVVKRFTARQITVQNEDLYKTGVTIYDQKTGDPICMFIFDGDVKTEPGSCEDREEPFEEDDEDEQEDDSQDGQNDGGGTGDAVGDANAGDAGNVTGDDAGGVTGGDTQLGDDAGGSGGDGQPAGDVGDVGTDGAGGSGGDTESDAADTGSATGGDVGGDTGSTTGSAGGDAGDDGQAGDDAGPSASGDSSSGSGDSASSSGDSGSSGATASDSGGDSSGGDSAGVSTP
jgi:hypothetical protein